jgi:hypothetical protein
MSKVLVLYYSSYGQFFKAGIAAANEAAQKKFGMAFADLPPADADAFLRVLMALGFAVVGCAYFMAGELTHDWAGDDFLPLQIIQAVGQSFGLTALGLVRSETSADKRGLYPRRDGADRTPVRGRARYCFHPNLHTGARAGLF